MSDGSDETQAFDPFADDATRPIARPPAAPDELTQPITGPGVRSADPTLTQRIILPPKRSMAGWAIALFLVAALFAGAAIGYTQGTERDEGVLVRALVGPDGGVLAFGDGQGQLEIGKGALPTATAVTVRMVHNANRVRLGAEGDPSARIYEPGELDMYVFEPAGLRFQRPVTITIPRPAGGTALLIDTPSGLRVVGAEDEGDSITFGTTSFAFEDL